MINLYTSNYEIKSSEEIPCIKEVLWYTMLPDYTIFHTSPLIMDMFLLTFASLMSTPYMASFLAFSRKCNSASSGVCPLQTNAAKT